MFLTKKKAVDTPLSLRDIVLKFFFGTADVTGIVELPEGVEMVMPGDNLAVEIELQKSIAMEPGQRLLFVKEAKLSERVNISRFLNLLNL